MKDIDWRLLVVLYEKKSITKAAEALYMTQSALTKRIKSIETEWDIELVKRSSKGITFTEEGKYLTGKARIMIDFLGEIQTHFSENKCAKDLLKIGVPNSFARLHMPKLFQAYMKEFNRVQIKTVSNSSDAIMQKLNDGTVDIGIICGDYPYLGEKVCLFEEELYIVAPKGMKLDDLGHMPIIESFLNPMVKIIINQWWKNQFGSVPHEAHHVPYADIAIQMVESGLGICFLFGDSWKVNRDIVQMIPLYDQKGEIVSRKVWMMISERCYQSEDISDFITFVEKYYGVN